LSESDSVVADNSDEDADSGLQEQEAADPCMAVLLIAHDLNLVRRFGQRVAVMEKGVLVEISTTSELLSNPHHPYKRRPRNSAPEHAIDPIASHARRLPEVQGLSLDCRTSAKGWRLLLQWWRTRRHERGFASGAVSSGYGLVAFFVHATVCAQRASGTGLG
jgi:ABC-type glutathione transport system ATPase component